ncbi:MAG: fused MFS/spermidine synthase [Armatimonadetes bacterium]|nr:fused MFS/spermidine synthase [Armatimonadota bacterium]
MWMWATTIFLSAFLLFQVQPILAKAILPWFGGSAAVWTTCILFFQSFLLLGYLYAHGSFRYLRPKTQSVLHLSLLGLSLAFLPVLPRDTLKPTGSEDPTLRILLLLAVTVGLPYFLLSTTGPLLQAWYAARRTAASPKESFPYRLYALSNAGSMLALLTYPILAEPLLTTRQQSLFWSVGYGFFTLLCGLLAFRSRHDLREGGAPGDRFAEPLKDDRPSWKLHLVWVAYAACSSALLLAVTNHLSHNVASIPFLWILPLSLYLLSFIVCFSGAGWRWSRLTLLLPPAALGGMAFLLSEEFTYAPPRDILLPFTLGFFVLCILCHGEIARLKPPPRHLTSFYLMISLGGALGGLFVAVLAPLLFVGYIELPLALAGCALLAWLTLYRYPKKSWRAPAEFVKAGAVLVLLAYLFTVSQGTTDGYRWSARNFYGMMRVKDEGNLADESAVRKFYSGSILHGRQYLHPKHRREPLTYYTAETGIGRLFRAWEGRGPKRVGVIGLGAGSLASYGRPGDVFRMYEINPLVIRMAWEQFTFLRDTPAKVEVVPGDARLALEREPNQRFDVLVMDAFFSDAVPVHLLTREAFEQYFRHLKKDGVLAVNISNKYLDLRPVIERAADAMGKEARLVTEAGPSWALLTERGELFRHPAFAGVTETLEWREGFRIWTDDYSNLFQILK